MKIIIRALLILIFAVSSPLSAKDKKAVEEKPQLAFANTLGSTFLLIGTASSRTVEDILSGVESMSKKTKGLSLAQRDFLFGYAHYRVGEYKEADQLFKKCSGDINVIRDYILYYRGSIALNLKNYSAAESFYEELIQNYKESVLLDDALLGLSEAKIALKKYDNARRLISEAMNADASGENNLRARLLIIESYLNEGRAQETADHLRRMTLSVRDEIELSKITELIEQADKRFRFDLDSWINSAPAQYQIAESLMNHYQWNDAINHLEYAIKNLSRGSELYFDAKWLYARAHFKAHLYREVIPLLEELLKNGDGGRRLSILQHLASAYARVDDYDRSIDIRKKIIRDYPRHSGTVLDSNSKIAFLLVDEGKYKEAIDAWNKVLSLKGSSQMKSRALWYIAWSYYKLKDYDRAINQFDNILKIDRNSGKIKDRLMYWKARSLEKLGRTAQARALYESIYAKYPLGYYGVLAARRLRADERGSADFAKAGTHRKGRDRWRPARPDEMELQGSVHLLRAVFFDDLDLHEEAAAELRAVSFDIAGSSKKTRRHKKALEGMGDSSINYLMWLSDRNFAPDISFVLSHRKYLSILKTSNPPVSGFSRFVWEQSYPEAYKPVVDVLSYNDLDPRLVYSIMRAESTFRKNVVSSAGAIGLLQLMPTTAQKMSREAGESHFDIRSLYRPSNNIEYGIRYLKKLQKLFPQNTVAVIASYNAGEEAVGRWLKHGYSPDIEEFIEEIPYDETNLYVKKVLRYYWIYQDMYSN